MDRYRAVEYLFDWRAPRPSFEEMVFWRDIGTWDEEDEVDALERCGMIATDMLCLEVASDRQKHCLAARVESYPALRE